MSHNVIIESTTPPSTETSIIASPFLLSERTTFDTINLNVNTLVAGSCRMEIHG
jgi:hypothetical protein